MPRRRPIKIITLATIVLLCGFIAISVLSGGPPEAYYQGHSASYWLRAFSSNIQRSSISHPSQPQEFIEAFRQMGTNAQPVLAAALDGKENHLAKMYRRLYSRLPAEIRQHLPQLDEPWAVREAAMKIALSPLQTRDSGIRRAALDFVENRVGPQDGRQTPTLLLAANDTDEEVRMKAVWMIWRISGQTNALVPFFEEVLSQSRDERHRHWAACHLLEMGQSSPLLTTIFINSLTNDGSAIRMSACSCLGQIGPPAAAAIPALRKVLQDTDPEVRQRAKIALSRVDPEHE